MADWTEIGNILQKPNKFRIYARFDWQIMHGLHQKMPVSGHAATSIELAAHGTPEVGIHINWCTRGWQLALMERKVRKWKTKWSTFGRKISDKDFIANLRGKQLKQFEEKLSALVAGLINEQLG